MRASAGLIASSVMSPCAAWRCMFFSMRAERLAQRVLVDVVQHHVITRQRQDMGDAGAHLARADYADAFDTHDAYLCV